MMNKKEKDSVNLLSRAVLTKADRRRPVRKIFLISVALSLAVVLLGGAAYICVVSDHRNLSWVNFSGVDLNEAKLNRAKLNWADLRGAKLNWADLREANLNDAKLNRADLRGADLSGAKLNGADLSGADLRGAKLNWADLRGAKLNWADLRGADLSGVDLSGADLRGAVIHNVKGLTPDQLAQMKNLEHAFLDPGRYADAVAAGYKPKE